MPLEQRTFQLENIHKHTFELALNQALKLVIESLPMLLSRMLVIHLWVLMRG